MRCRRALPLVAILFVVVAAPTACSGASDTDHLLSGGGPVSTGGHDAGHDTGSQGNSGQDSGTAPHVDAGGPVVDSSTPVVDTGVPLPEASPEDVGPVGDTFACPPSTCSSPDVCCASSTGPGQTTYKCQSAGKVCGSTAGSGTPIACATSADCAGGVCCGVNDNNGHYVKVACAADCTGQDANGDTLIQFCDPSANDCPTGQQCNPSQLLQGFNVCQ